MSYWGSTDDLTTGGIDMSGQYGAAPGNTLSMPSMYPAAPTSYPVASAGAPSLPNLPPPTSMSAPGSTLSGGGLSTGQNPLNALMLAALLSQGGGMPGFGGGSGGLGGLGGLLSLFGLGGSGFGGIGGFGQGIADQLGGLAGSELGGLFGINQGASSGMGSEFGGLAGGALGSLLFGPLGGLAGGFGGSLLGDLLGGWIGGGLPEMAKPQGFASALTASGDPLEALLGNYIQKYGINKGFDLSEPFGKTPFNASWMGDVLELLGGQQFSGLKHGMLTPGGQTGYQNPVGLPVDTLQQLQGMVPDANTLSLFQLQQIMPEMAALLGHSGGRSTGGLQGLLGRENELAGKLRMAEAY